VTGHALASQRRCAERIVEAWPGFQRARGDRLDQHVIGGRVTERVTENILERLFVDVLNWPTSAVKYQIDNADMLLTSLGIKYAVIEAKRPGAFDHNSRAVAEALDQGWGYAQRQQVRCVVVSDGTLLDARDVTGGGLLPRLRVHLSTPEPPESLWWLSMHGIYRPAPPLAQPWPVDEIGEKTPHDECALVHPRYRLPSRCFAYVGHADRPATWKLPYLHEDGSVDLARLPKAIGAVLRGYRGARVSLPEEAVPEVLVRLALAASRVGHMPYQTVDTAGCYVALEDALSQLDRLNEIVNAT